MILPPGNPKTQPLAVTKRVYLPVHIWLPQRYTPEIYQIDTKVWPYLKPDSPIPKQHFGYPAGWKTSLLTFEKYHFLGVESGTVNLRGGLIFEETPKSFLYRTSKNHTIEKGTSSEPNLHVWSPVVKLLKFSGSFRGNLVGGWTNPSEKYANVKIGSIFQGSGWK